MTLINYLINALMVSFFKIQNRKTQSLIFQRKQHYLEELLYVVTCIICVIHGISGILINTHTFKLVSYKARIKCKIV